LLAGTDLVTDTDFDGNFYFNSLKPGKYTIVTNYISYEKVIREVNIDKGSNNLNLGYKASK